MIQFISRLFRWLRAGLSGRTWSMAIVRRYADANGAYVGELYLLGTFAGVLQYTQIGMSLDTLPLDIKQMDSVCLDVDNDFLKPMPVGCIRVGAQDPRDNDVVKESVRRLASRGRISLRVENRFVEWVMQSQGRRG